MTGWQVQGMGLESVEADWPPLRPDEVSAVLAAYGSTAGRAARIVWRSRRPLSAAAIVELGGAATGHPPGVAERVFVKRHHAAVRRVADLVVEHDLADHLRRRGVPVPEVLRTPSGPGGWEAGGWTWEVSRVGRGVDRYRHVRSWMPYSCAAHASAAGEALAGLHRAAADFTAPARPVGVLRNGDRVATAADPVAVVATMVAGRPALRSYLAGRDWAGQLARAVGPLATDLQACLEAVGRPPSQWGHGDWHPSNLLWSDHDAAPVAVSSVLDLGLADRTSAPFDLAVALERATVGWLDLPGAGRAPVDLDAASALLAGYRLVRPLDGGQAALVAAMVPLVHLDFALSEVEYFAGVVGRPALADLAWEGYALAHLRWWRSPDGRRYLAALEAELLRAP